MGRKNYLLAALLSQSLLALSLYIYPIRFTGEMSVDAVLGYTTNPLILSLLVEGFTITCLVTAYLASRVKNGFLALISLAIYTIILTNFWNLHSVTGLPPAGDALARTTELSLISQTGHIDFRSPLYYGFPGLDAFSTSILVALHLSTLQTAHLVTLISVFCEALFAFMVFSLLLSSIFKAYFATLAMVTGDILIYHGSQLIFPATLSFVMVIFALYSLLTRHGGFGSNITFITVLWAISIIHPADPPVVVGTLLILYLFSILRGRIYSRSLSGLVLASAIAALGYDSYTAIFDTLRAFFVKTNSKVAISTGGMSHYLLYFEQLIKGNVFSPSLPLWVSLPQLFWILVILGPVFMVAVGIIRRNYPAGDKELVQLSYLMSAGAFTFLTFLSGYGDPTRFLGYAPLVTIPLLIGVLGRHRRLMIAFLLVVVLISAPTFFAFNIVQPAYNVTKYQNTVFVPRYAENDSLVFTDSLEASVLEFGSVNKNLQLEYPAVGTTPSRTINYSNTEISNFLSEPNSILVYYPTYFYNLIHFDPAANPAAINTSRLYGSDVIYDNGLLTVFFS